MYSVVRFSKSVLKAVGSPREEFSRNRFSTKIPPQAKAANVDSSVKLKSWFS